MRNLEIKNNDSLAPCGRESQSGLTLLPESGADAPTVLSAVYTDSTPAKNRQADVPQYGRSMIEMLGVLAIIGVLSVGGIAGYSKAMMKYRINKTIEQITLIAGNVRTFFANQQNYNGLDSGCSSGKAIIKKAKLVPDEMWENGYITTAFGTGLALHGRNKAESGDSQAFSIETNFGNPEPCIEILSHDLTNMGAKAVIGGCSSSENFAYKTPVSVDKAIEACSMCDGNPDVAIYFDINIGSSEWPESFFTN